MSDISTKLTYLNTTKSQLKDQINYGLPTEKQITSSTTFRNYVSSIFEAFLEALRNPDTLFTNLPKTSDSGSQITLNGTANAPMRINLNPTAISQTTYTGKNLYDFKNYKLANQNGMSRTEQDGKYIFTTQNTGYCFSQYNLTLEAGTYSWIIDTNTGSNKIVLIGQTEQSNPFTITETKSVGFRVYIANATIGQSVTLNNITLCKGSTPTTEPYTGGTASPNPSYPQDIHTISGNNSVVVEGKNIAQSKYINSSTSRYINVLFIEANLQPSTQYTISFKGTNGNSLYTNQNVIQGWNVVNVSNNITTLTFTTTATLDKTSSSQYVSGEGWNIFKNNQVQDSANIFDDLMLEKGNKATSYEPYVSQTNPINLGEYELGTIGNYSNEFVRSGGENICDYDINTDYTNQYLDNSGNWTTAVGYTYTKQKINITTKTISVSIGSKVGNPNIRIGQFQSNGTFITRTLINTSTNNITLDNNCSYIWLSIDKDTTNNSYFKDISINYGTTALPYVPYEKGWYYKQGIGKVVLDGTESWEERTNSGNVKQFFCPTTLTDVLLGADNMQLCNYAKFNRSTFNWGAVGDFSILDNTKRFYICVNSSTTLSDFKTTIASNNIIAYVQQATPTYTKITGELAQELESVYKGMLSYDGTTNISQVNNDLSFNLGASAITK